jgi:hypothetical protein
VKKSEEEGFTSSLPELKRTNPSTPPNKKGAANGLYFCEDWFGRGCTDALVNLKPYGSRVWLEWHNYLGPSFYRGPKSAEEIRMPGKKTWEVFERWKKDYDNQKGNKR